MTHSINGGAARTISQSEYKSLRQLSKRSAGSLQVSYAYGLGGSVTHKFGSGPSTTTYYAYNLNDCSTSISCPGVTVYQNVIPFHMQRQFN